MVTSVPVSEDWVRSTWLASASVGRMTSQSKSRVSTVQVLGSSREIVVTGWPAVPGTMKYPVRAPGVSVQATRHSFPPRRARPRRNCRSVPRWNSVCPSGVCLGESFLVFPAAGVKPWLPKIVLATSPSVCPAHSTTLSSTFMSHDASWAQMSMVDETDARSRCSRHDKT